MKLTVLALITRQSTQNFSPFLASFTHHPACPTNTTNSPLFVSAMNADFVSAMDGDDLSSAFGPLLPYYPQSPPHLPSDTALYPQVVRDLLARQQGPRVLIRGALVIGRGEQALDRSALGASSLPIAPCNDAQPAADDAGDPKPQACSASALTLAERYAYMLFTGSPTCS